MHIPAKHLGRTMNYSKALNLILWKNCKKSSFVCLVVSSNLRAPCMWSFSIIRMDWQSALINFSGGFESQIYGVGGFTSLRLFPKKNGFLWLPLGDARGRMFLNLFYLVFQMVRSDWKICGSPTAVSLTNSKLPTEVICNKSNLWHCRKSRKTL